MSGLPYASGSHVVLVGPLPPPVHGTSVAFAALADSLTDAKVVDISRTPRTGMLDALLRAFSVLRSAATVGRSSRPTVCYLTIAQSRAGVLRDVLIVRAARAREMTVIAHLHGGNYLALWSDAPPWLRRVIRSMFRQIDTLVLLSDMFVEQFGFLDTGATGVRVISVPNGVEPPASLFGATPRTLDPERELHVIFLSNLIHSKGVAVAVQAVGLLRRRGIDARLRLVGEDRLDEAGRGGDVDELLDRLEAHAFVDHEGPARGSAKWDALTAADVLILPSRYANEGQPISVIEAMAVGLPVVVSNHRALPELALADEPSGIVVDSDDPRDYADALERLAKDSRLYEGMSAAALRKQRTSYGMRHHLSMLHDLLVERHGS